MTMTMTASGKRFILVGAVWVGFLAAGAYAQATTQPAQPVGGEELKSAPKAAPEAAEKAAETQPVSKQAPTAPGGRTLFDSWLLPVMLGALLLLLLWSSRSRKKQEAKRKEMLAALKKGDKVTSVGGVIGTIVEVRDDEIVVKVDETNNVRMRFARWAIRGVGEEAKTETPADRK